MMNLKPQNRNTLWTFGLKATKIYVIILVFIFPAGLYLGWIKLEPITLNEIGDFLAGLFGPLAIFWLVLGFLQQGDELQNSVDALNLQAKELKASVDQQRAMVDITNKQLELDVQVRQDEMTAAVSRELPFIRLHATSSGGASRPGCRSYNFRIQNLGENATNVTVTLDDQEVLPNNENYGLLKTHEIYDFFCNVPNHKPHGPSWSAIATITSKNLRGQIRTQQYKIGNFDPIEISCDPKQM